jgi:phospholipid transport system substrate-binding protein
LLLALGLLALAAMARPALAAGDARDAVNRMRQAFAEASLEETGGEAPRLRRLERVTSNHTDMAYTAKLMLREGWDSADERQRHDFVAAFRGMLVSSYASQLAAHASQTTVLSSPRVDASGRLAEVRTRVSAFGMPELDVDYRLHRTVDGWKVYDLSVDGVGIVATYGASLRQRLHRVGMDGVIRELLARGRQLRDT